VTSTEKAYYDLIASIENVTVTEISLQLNEQLLAETKQRVKVGVASRWTKSKSNPKLPMRAPF